MSKWARRLKLNFCVANLRMAVRMVVANLRISVANLNRRHFDFLLFNRKATFSDLVCTDRVFMSANSRQKKKWGSKGKETSAGQNAAK